MSRTVVLFVVLLTSSCLTRPDDTTCLRGVKEADLSPVAWSGPGVVGGALPPGHYVIAATYLKGRPEGFDTFQQVLGPIITALPTTDGLVGYATQNSSSCFTARTLSVWRDEASMFQFVSSPAHSNAMAKVNQVSRGGSLTTHWSATEAGATLEEALAHLAVAPDQATF
jgi:quinol monooxygenase YgiN